jgi:hypothetical protein
MDFAVAFAKCLLPLQRDPQPLKGEMCHVDTAGIISPLASYSRPRFILETLPTVFTVIGMATHPARDIRIGGLRLSSQ